MVKHATISAKVTFLAVMPALFMSAIFVFYVMQMSKLSAHLTGNSEEKTIITQMLTTGTIFSILIIFAGISLGIFVARGISRTLTAAVEVANQIAGGDYNIHIETPPGDETGKLLDIMKQMAISIRDTEDSLKQQTKELTKTNESLRTEIAERKEAEEALRVSQEYAENIINSSLDMIIAVNTDRHIIEFNPAAQKTFGYTPKEVIGKHVDILYADDREASSIYEHTIRDGERVQEIFNKRKNGEVFPCLLSASILRDASGNMVGFMGISRDITDQKRTEERLRQHNHELGLLSQLSELLQACRAEQETYKVIENMCKQFFPHDSGFLAIMDESRSQLEVMSSWGEPKSDIPEFGIDDCWALRRGKIHCIEPPDTGPLCSHFPVAPTNGYLCAPISASGETLGTIHLHFGQLATDEYTGEPVGMMEPKCIVAGRVAEHYALSLVNIRLRETLKQDAIRDALTGMYNRRYMEGSLERETRRAERRHTPVGIIMIDVDHFKLFNDTHGHEAGDLVLQELGRFLRKNTRGEDIACRYGGEEFLLIMPEASLENTRLRAEFLREGAQKIEFSYRGEQLHITISVGVAAVPDHGVNVKNAVNAADTALYKAKAGGRNQVVVA